MLCCLAGAGTAVAFDQPQVYQLKPKDRVVIMGDSTTVGGCGVAGYVQLVNQALQEQLPDQNITVGAKCKNTRTTATLLGKGGCVTEMKESLGKPDFSTVVIINLGLNDSKSAENCVAPFTDNLRQAVTLLREMKVTPIVCAPSVWGGVTQTKPYAEAARALPAEMKVPLIDLYAAHADHVVSSTKDGKLLPGTNPTDGVTRLGMHLSVVGETLSARAILQALGLRL
jgi:lysophospholipase L1-like esterase